MRVVCSGGLANQQCALIGSEPVTTLAIVDVATTTTPGVIVIESTPVPLIPTTTPISSTPSEGGVSIVVIISIVAGVVVVLGLLVWLTERNLPIETGEGVVKVVQKTRLTPKQKVDLFHV
jgi:hypothetical protein